MTASLMFATYNRLDLTKQMLDSLFKNTDYPYHILIVDNGSTDGSCEWLKNLTPQSEFCLGIDIQFNEKNLGIAAARNQGLQMSNKYQDDWLSTLDNDVELPFGWLKECIEIMEANPEFALGLNMEGRQYPLMTRNNKTFQYKHEGNLGTACTVFNRQLFKLIGYFTTEYGLFGEEDADYFFRARRVGWNMAYLERMGTHLGQGDLDIGEYREFKNEWHKSNLTKFRANCMAYYHGKKPLFIPFSDKPGRDTAL